MYTFIPVVSKNDKILSNALQFLAIDAVEAANAGHPGLPMGMADIVEVLWRNYLRHNPKDPAWPNRDRFVLSNGHGSMLLYGLLHLTGYDLHQRDLFGFNFERVIELARSVVERHRRTASAN